MGSQQSKHQSGFERLPLEVRQEIYGYLGYPVVEDQVIHCEKFVKVFIPVRERHWFVDGTGRHAHNYLKISDVGLKKEPVGKRNTGFGRLTDW